MRPHCDIGIAEQGSKHRQTDWQEIQEQHANPEGSAAVPSGLSPPGSAISPLRLRNRFQLNPMESRSIAGEISTFQPATW
jgi:hypothetical protein